MEKIGVLDTFFWFSAMDDVEIILVSIFVEWFTFVLVSAEDQRWKAKSLEILLDTSIITTI